MVRRSYTPEQIINKLREAEVLLSGSTGQTYYRWRKEYGGMRVAQAKRLKKLVTDLFLDNVVLKEAAQGNL